MGFSLREIRELLSLRADPTADCSMVRAQAVAKLGEIRLKIEQLRQLSAGLEALIALCPGHGSPQVCSILDTLADPGRLTDFRIPADGALPSAPPKRARQRVIQPSRRKNSRRAP